MGTTEQTGPGLPSEIRIGGPPASAEAPSAGWEARQSPPDQAPAAPPAGQVPSTESQVPGTLDATEPPLRVRVTELERSTPDYFAPGDRFVVEWVDPGNRVVHLIAQDAYDKLYPQDNQGQDQSKRRPGRPRKVAEPV